MEKMTRLPWLAGDVARPVSSASQAGQKETGISE